MKILNNSQINIILIKNSKSQNCTKYIDIIYHYMRKPLKDKEQGNEQIPSLLMFINSLIKTLFTRDIKRLYKKRRLISQEYKKKTLETWQNKGER